MMLELLGIAAQTVDGRQIDDEFNWPLAIMIVGVMFAFATALSVLVWQGLATWRARMSIAREEAYRELAEQAVAAEQETDRNVKTIIADLADIRQRTAEIERVLKEVG